MAHSLSAKKRIRQNLKRQARNRQRKKRIRLAIRAFDQAVASQDRETAKEALNRAVKLLDQVAAKGTIAQRTAARRKSQLAKRLNTLPAPG